MLHSVWQNAHLGQLDKGWQKVFEACLNDPEMEALASFLQTHIDQNIALLPVQSDWFNAFKLTPLKQVKVVVLGQDPYHGFEKGQPQAHGLSFSVNEGVKVPPSLRNIFKELESDLDLKPCVHGNLTQWAERGVLLLNTVLTVESGKAGAHQNRGWEHLTDQVIKVISQNLTNVVFMLWGKPAHAKAGLIDAEKHLVLQAAHPSPLSAYRGFLGCAHFSKANHYLQQTGQGAIDWQLEPIAVEPDQIQLI
jgi:uracil-DNA glycosylase